jgi:hypothetical protein
VRHVARDALLGIHSARILPIPGREPNGPLPTVDDLHRVLKRYVIEMGVDPGLIDAAAKISADTVRFLSRDEIARFGIEVRDFYETSWMLHQQEGTKQQIVFKSVTRAGAGGGRELRTGNIRMWCTGSGTGVWLVYRRETPANEEAAPVVRVAAGDREYKLEGTRTRTPINPGWTKAHEVLSRYLVGVRAPPPGTEDRTATVSLEFLRNATAAPSIAITEEPASADAGAARVIKLSTGGLAKALQPLLQDCAPVPKFFDSPAVKFLDGPGPSGSR